MGGCWGRGGSGRLGAAKGRRPLFFALAVAWALVVGVASPVRAHESAASSSKAAAASAAPASPITWQSAGDSFSSGEGVYGNVGGCAQSDRAYGPLTVARLASERDWDVASTTFTACTGHLVEDYFNGRDGGRSLWDWGRDQGGPAQVDVITMSFGGNDIGFANLLVDCLPVPDSWVGYIPTVETLASNLTGCDPSEADIARRIDALLDPPTACSGTRRSGDGFGCDLNLGGRRGSIIDFYYDVVTQRLTKRGQLYVVGYPRLFAPTGQWPRWSKLLCQGIGRGDTEKLGRLSEHLNAKLKEAVDRVNQVFDEPRVHYVDRLALHRDGDHELCGTGADWLNGVAFDRGDGTIRRETSFHPNAASHAAVAGALVDLVDSTFPTAPEQPALLELSPSGLGPIRIGMTTAEVTATGLVGRYRPGCEFFGPGLEVGELTAPLEGAVYLNDGVVYAVSASEGAITVPGGVRPGDDLDVLRSAMESEGFTVTEEFASEEVFGHWFVDVFDGDTPYFGATVDPSDNKVLQIFSPSLQSCD